MAENIQKIKTRYPFGGFYLKLLPEAERKELESMPEEVLLSEPLTTIELTNTVEPAESVVVEPVPRPAIEAIPAETLLAPADSPVEPALANVAEGEQIPTAPEPSEETPTITDRHAGKIEWVGDLIGDEFKQWGHELVAIEAMTGTGKTAFILGTLLKWCVDECHRTDGRRSNKILFLCNRVPLRDEILDALRKAGVPNAIH